MLVETARNGSAPDESQRLVDEAKRQIELAIELLPNNAGFHTQVGRILLAAEERIKAKSHFERALELDPDDFLARLHLEELSDNEASLD